MLLGDLPVALLALKLVVEPLERRGAGDDKAFGLRPLLDLRPVLAVPLVDVLHEVVEEVVRCGPGVAEQPDVAGLLLYFLDEVPPHGIHLDVPLLVVLFQNLPEGVTGFPLCPEFGLGHGLLLLLFRLRYPLLPGGECLELGHPLEGLVVLEDVLDVFPAAEHGDVLVLGVRALDLLHVLLALFPPVLLDLLLVLLHEVLEELVALGLVYELEEVPLAEGLRHVLVAAGDLEILPVLDRRDVIVPGALPLLPLLLLRPLLGLGHILGEDLLALARGVQGVEAPVLLDEFQGLLPLHVALDSPVVEQLPEGGAALLRRGPLGLLLLLRLLLILAVLVPREAPLALQLEGHLPDALLRHWVVEVVPAICRLVLLPVGVVHLLLRRLQAVRLVPAGLLGDPVVVVPAAI
mmetsp:Transcript_55326/g.171394  ORF Transcript_55326/g.171394 Transcript_55326/m.171394 type:complete len:406 (+) Transcript_55326:469-1686(+)